MHMEKLKYSKCPNCKKYGMDIFRGIGIHSTYVETCRYCGKKYQVNWALAFLIKLFVPLIWVGIMLIINTYFINISEWVVVLFGLLIFYLIIRICPMEEVKDKE